MIDFFLVGHDFPMVLLAAVVCLVSAYACISLMHHARRTTGRMRLVWNLVSALSVGIGIWATHFIAVLAFRPGFSLGYDFGLTLLSMLIAVMVCGGGIALAVHSKGWADRLLGGVTVGVGISAMHYTGMAALLLDGEIVWQSGAVTLSILGGMGLAGLSFALSTEPGWRRNMIAATFLTLAICVMHFTAMFAADFSNCLPASHGIAGDSGLMSIIVAGTSLIVLAAAIGSLVLDEADRRRTDRETQRRAADAKRLAEVNERLNLALTHMGQGLALFGSDGKLLLHNQRLLDLLGLPADTALAGLDMPGILERALDGPGQQDVAARAVEMWAPHSAVIVNGGGEMIQPIGSDAALRVRHSPAGERAWITTVEDITESRRHAAAIAHLAHHDSLTGLPNRALQSIAGCGTGKVAGRREAGRAGHRPQPLQGYQ